MKPTSKAQMMLGAITSAITLGATTSARAADGTWTLDGQGYWTTPANWAAGIVPNGVGDSAYFPGAITSIVSVGPSSVTLGHLIFENNNGSNIEFVGALALEVASGSADITVLSGSHGITGVMHHPLTLLSDTNIIGPGSFSEWDSLSNTANLSIQTTVNAGRINGIGNVTVSASSSLSALRIRQNSLSIDGSLSIAYQGAVEVSALNSLTLGDTAELDINRSAFIVNYSGPSPRSTFETAIAKGFSGGAWTGKGITSSAAAASSTDHRTAVGIAEASDLYTTFPNTFMGLSIDSSSALFRYTLSGDANLDGIVDTLDFNSLAAGFASPSGRWFTGDFNYDGVANTSDFNALAANFGFTLSGSDVGALVPEPSASAFLAIAMSALLIQTRRRQRSNELRQRMAP